MKRWPKSVNLQLSHEDVALFELRGWEKWPYCLVCTTLGWVALDRSYEKVVGGGHLLDGGEVTAVDFAADPRQVGGCFTSVNNATCYLYETQFDSAPKYLDRLKRLIALREGCLGRG